MTRTSFGAGTDTHARAPPSPRSSPQQRGLWTPRYERVLENIQSVGESFNLAPYFPDLVAKSHRGGKGLT